MLPNFLCIGAQKSGTTSIWHILNAHSNICMAQPKETRFFYDDFLFEEGLSKYELTYFSHWKNEKMVGEKCPEYFYVPNVSKRIYDNLGKNVKFIVTLRNPAQRAFSHYRHNLNMLRETRSFKVALAEESEQIRQKKWIPPPFGYIQRGFYASQIQEYFNFFPTKQFLFIHFENEILSNQKLLAFKLYHFLNIKPIIPLDLPFKSGHPKLEELTVNYFHNSSNAKNRYVEIIRKHNSAKKLFYKKTKNSTKKIYAPSEKLISFAKSFSNNKPLQNKLSVDEAKQINLTYYKKEIEQLQKMINFDTNHWLAPNQ